MIVVNWVSFIRNIFFLVKSIFLSAGGAFEVQFLVLRMSPALNRFISIRWTMQKWPVTGGSLYFKSKCSPEHLFQQKFKLMVKPLCEVASFLFLRSCMYSTLYFFLLYSSARYLLSCSPVHISNANLCCIYLLCPTLVYLCPKRCCQAQATWTRTFWHLGNFRGPKCFSIKLNSIPINNCLEEMS